MAEKTLPAEKRIRFDGTINLGHILTFVGFMAAGISAWNLMDKRVVILEEARLVQVQTDKRQDEDRAEMKKAMREDVKELMRKIDMLLERGR